jgi:DOPA 4,5-dioxygenase
VFTHPNTGDDLGDHTQHVIWLGASERLRLDFFQRGAA